MPETVSFKLIEEQYDAKKRRASPQEKQANNH